MYTIPTCFQSKSDPPIKLQVTIIRPHKSTHRLQDSSTAYATKQRRIHHVVSTPVPDSPLNSNDPLSSSHVPGTPIEPKTPNDSKLMDMVQPKSPYNFDSHSSKRRGRVRTTEELQAGMVGRLTHRGLREGVDFTLTDFRTILCHYCRRVIKVSDGKISNYLTHVRLLHKAVAPQILSPTATSPRGPYSPNADVAGVPTADTPVDTPVDNAVSPHL